MTDWNAVSAFMAKVVAWPGSPTDPGYVNLHFSTVDRKNPTGPVRKGSGWPFRSLDPFISRAWMNTTTQFKDAWYCLSLQSQTKPNAKDPTKPRAHRLAANALKLKAIWIDIDVGVEAKKYDTLQEAMKAIFTFREKVGLPAFSALVCSGSGLHAYWISKDELTRAEWEPYAQGLKVLLLQEGIKCDAGLTTDSARILRIPGTFNHKTNPPKPVELLNLPLALYDFPTTLDFLTHLAPIIVPGSGKAELNSLFADDADLASFKLPPILKADPNETLGKVEERKLDATPIFQQCGYYSDAFANGGKEYAQPLWMYSVLGTTFMENGRALAHEISKGHANYTPAETDAMYDRKLAERRDRGLGYPQCSTIQGAGCKACMICPHLKNGKSPLNFSYQEHASKAGATKDASNRYEPIELDDPLLAKLPAKWFEVLCAADYSAAYGNDRSRAEMAFATEAIRAGIDDSTIARCLMDKRRAFGSNTRRSDRLLIRVIDKARQYADDPVLEQMNRDFAAGFIGNKFRIAKFDLQPRYPLQRKVEFLSKDDFINGVVNPRVDVPKFGQDGKEDGTKSLPRGTYWFGLEGRSEFDAVTFKPGAPPIIEVERNGGVHRSINTYSGFSVTSDRVDSENKCFKFLQHIRDNIAGGDQSLFKYLLDWMASGVQHPDDPGRSALSMRGAPGCGKGVFALGYGHLFGQHFLHATHKEHVTGKFNAHQAETCLIFVDEALYAEIETDAQILKTMTSETTKLLERKGIDTIAIDNYARPIFSTNDEHPIQIEHNDRRYPAIYVRENDAFAHEKNETKKAKNRKAYFAPIIEELKNGGSEALLGLLLDRDIRDFNAEAIPETYERLQQKLSSAPSGDKVIIEFAQDGCLPGAIPNRPWIARAHGESWLPKHLQTPGLYDVMKARGGTKLARMSDTALSGILKSWGFKSKSLGSSRGWEAPPLTDLRNLISAKFRAVEFDGRQEWIARDAQTYGDHGATTDDAATPQAAEDIGEPNEGGMPSEEPMGRREQEKPNCNDETVSCPTRRPKTRFQGKPAKPVVDPVTGLTSAAAVSAFVRGACRS
jgi:Family of unknown function (DUF5906)